jgi:hypothetical protein
MIRIMIIVMVIVMGRGQELVMHCKVMVVVTVIRGL